MYCKGIIVINYFFHFIHTLFYCTKQKEGIESFHSLPYQTSLWDGYFIPFSLSFYSIQPNVTLGLWMLDGRIVLLRWRGFQHYKCHSVNLRDQIARDLRIRGEIVISLIYFSVLNHCGVARYASSSPWASPYHQVANFLWSVSAVSIRQKQHGSITTNPKHFSPFIPFYSLWIHLVLLIEESRAAPVVVESLCRVEFKVCFDSGSPSYLHYDFTIEIACMNSFCLAYTVIYGLCSLGSWALFRFCFASRRIWLNRHWFS